MTVKNYCDITWVWQKWRFVAPQTHLWYVDSFVLRNPLLRKALKTLNKSRIPKLINNNLDMRCCQQSSSSLATKGFKFK